MYAFLLRRFGTLVLTLLAVSAVVFAIMNVLPGDPALVILGIDSTPEAQAALREQLGLNAPLVARYRDWMLAALTGDFGISYSYDLPVSTLILERLPVTLPLALAATFMMAIAATGLGLFAAMRHGRPGDWGIMVLSQVGIAIPAFWLGILLIILFAVTLRVLPPGGFPGWDEPVAALKALILPAVALALVQAAILTRVVRSSVLDVMRLDYVRTARAKGLSRNAVYRRHVLPNALIPIITIVGLQVANLVTGTIVIENVFSLPGLGRLLFQAIANRDLFLVQALVLLFAAAVVIANFLVDIAYVVIDPRLEGRLE